MRQFDLKLASGKTVVWDGETPLAAAHRYAQAHPGEAVAATRRHSETNIVMPYADPRLIMEPAQWKRHDELERQRWDALDRSAGRI